MSRRIEHMHMMLTPEEKAALAEASAGTRVPRNVLVREGIARVLAEYARTGAVEFGGEVSVKP